MERWKSGRKHIKVARISNYRYAIAPTPKTNQSWQLSGNHIKFEILVALGSQPGDLNVSCNTFDASDGLLIDAELVCLLQGRYLCSVPLPRYPTLAPAGTDRNSAVKLAQQPECLLLYGV